MKSADKLLSTQCKRVDFDVEERPKANAPTSRELAAEIVKFKDRMKQCFSG
jgi:hypothetical protein